jgi:ribonuclease MRP protein subunit RMP1
MAPTLTADRALSLSTTEKTELATSLELLTRLYVRNVNQHRRSHWFASLVAFRKQLGLLLSEIRAAEGDEKGKKAREARDGAKEKVRERLGFWDRAGVHQWYL